MQLQSVLSIQGATCQRRMQQHCQGRGQRGLPPVTFGPARELGFELCEWRAPVPTLWDEHLYQARRAWLALRRARDLSPCCMSKRSSLSISSQSCLGMRGPQDKQAPACV